MGSNRRQIVALAVLLLVLAVVIWWQTTRTGIPVPLPASPGPAAATPPAAVPGRAPAGPRRAEEIPAVALTRLREERLGVVDSGRDPFRFGARTRPADADGGGGTRPGLNAGLPGRGPGGSPAPPVTGSAAPPPIGLKFIGIVRRSDAGVVLAVLSDGKGVYYGTEGDVIEGRYRILKIRDESVEMAYVDGRGQQRIPLSGA